MPGPLSAPACEALSWPPLSRPTRGPKGPRGDARVFHLIWGGSPPGGRGRAGPCRTTPRASRPCTTRAGPKAWPHGRRRARCGRRAWPGGSLARWSRRGLAAGSMATGPTPWPNKGRGPGLLGPQPPERRPGQRDDRSPWLCRSAWARGARQGDRHGAVARGPPRAEKSAAEGGWALRGASLHLAGGLEAAPNRPGSCPAGLSPHIPAPPHNRQRPKRGRKRRCNAALPALWRRGARPLAGADTNKATFPASPPASPRTSPVPPLGSSPQPYPHASGWGERGRPPGRPRVVRAARHTERRRRRPRARRKDWCKRLGCL